jgi:hypothetical protein
MSKKLIINDEVYKRRMRAFISKINEPLKTSILTQLTWFIQSAVKETLPKSKARKKRTVFTLTNSDAKKNKKRYRVPYRTFKKSGVAYFSSKKQALEFAKIKYRFLQKNQWIEAGKAITSNLKIKMRKTTMESKQKADALSNGVNNLSNIKPFLLLQLSSISSWNLRKAGVKATYKTQRRVKYNENKIVRDYSKNWKKTI